MKVLVTGGAGFIGANFVGHLLREHPDYDVVVLDKLTYAGNLRNLERALQNPRVQFVRQDICGPETAAILSGCDAVVHMAAESHVDRSIENAADFVRTNVEGTWRMLESCRQAKISRFVHVSTDEVYGSLGATGRFQESSPLHPNSPYAATKASSDLLVQAYVHTFALPAIITRCSNNYGPYQFPEKFIPLMIAQALANQPLPVYGDGQNVRDWIHVADHCRAVDVILHHGQEGEVYNIGGDCELRNLDVAKRILTALNRPHSLIQFVMDRPGHDRRYAMDARKLQDQLGWSCRYNFEGGLRDTIRWYQDNAAWLDETRSGAYRDYFERHYHRREKTFEATPSRN
jgi:dTDP-glucose 4,6-dehydratase